jgi:hypothetical protein
MIVLDKMGINSMCPQHVLLEHLRKEPARIDVADGFISLFSGNLGFSYPHSAHPPASGRRSRVGKVATTKHDANGRCTSARPLCDEGKESRCRAGEDIALIGF